MTATNATLNAIHSAQTAADTAAKVDTMATFIADRVKVLRRSNGDRAMMRSALDQIARATNEALRALEGESCLDTFTTIQSEALRQMVLAHDQGMAVSPARLLAFATEDDLDWLALHGWAREGADGWEPTPSGVRLVWSVD